MPKTKILIADDHRVVVEGIKSALRQHPEFEVAGEALDGFEAVKQVKSLKPDIVIIDISMPRLHGIDATKRIKKIDPDIRVIVFTMHSDKEYIINLFKVGISAYVLKDDPVSDLILAINVVKGGGTYFSTMVPATLIKHLEELEQGEGGNKCFEGLSARELEVFSLLADGKSIKETAWQLDISPKTVESHKYNIFAKLNARTISDLTRIAIRKKLIQP